MHLHDRAGTIASLPYKAEKPSVRLSDRHAAISAVSVLIEMRLV